MEAKQGKERRKLSRVIGSAFRLFLQDVKDNAVGLCAVILYLFLFQLIFHTVCPMQLLLGLPCPGCGLTRAALLFLQGHPIQAFWMHPFFYAWMALFVIWAAGRYLLQKKLRILPVLLALVIAGMLIFYIYRMKLYYPHTPPMNPLTEGFLQRIMAAVFG